MAIANSKCKTPGDKRFAIDADEKPTAKARLWGGNPHGLIFFRAIIACDLLDFRLDLELTKEYHISSCRLIYIVG